MSEIYKLTSKELLEINKWLIKSAELSDNARCFCGAGTNFSDCCKNKPNFWISDSYVKSLIGFIKSQNWNVTTDKIISFLVGRNGFENYYLKSYDLCARPDCVNSTTRNSHVYGKKHIEKHLKDTNCKINNPYKTNYDYFSSVGIKKEITFRIFCENCDHDIFASIDNPNHDIRSGKNILLHLLRTQAYQYQYTRRDLALSHQFVLGIKGIIETERYKSIGQRDTVLSGDWFIANNIRYQYQSELRNKLWGLYQNKTSSLKIPQVYTREVKTKQVLFASGIVNPSHDLSKNIILFNKEASIFYYIIPNDNLGVSVTIASFDEEYKDMIDQLANVNDYVFKKYFNHLITMSSMPLSIILPDSFKVTNKILSKINEKKLLMQKTQPYKPSDLDSRKIFASFLK